MLPKTVSSSSATFSSVEPSTPRPPERSQGGARGVHSPLCICRLCSGVPLSERLTPAPFVNSSRMARTPVDVITGVTLSRFWNTSSVILGSAALDWLTLTTYDNAAYRCLVELLGKLTDPIKRVDGRLMQYRGCSGDSYFFGDGLQAGRTHYLVRLSGSLAHHVIQEAFGSPLVRIALAQFKATRIDVQYTHADVLDIDLSMVVQELREVSWPSHRGKRPRIDGVDSDDGLDTLYIGKRKESNRFQRAYMKVVDEKALIRWEIEYKEQLASNLWEKLLSVGLSILAPIISGELAVIPLSPAFAPLIAGVGAAPDRLHITYLPSKDEDTLRWLWRTVAPALRRLTASTQDHVREEAKRFLEVALLGEEIESYLGPERSVSSYISSSYGDDVSIEL